MKVKIILICIIVACLSSSIRVEDSNEEEYPAVMKVIEVKENYLLLEDLNGNQWEADNPEDLEPGDICGVLMNNNGTSETIFDDEIITIRYCGR